MTIDIRFARAILREHPLFVILINHRSREELDRPFFVENGRMKNVLFLSLSFSRTS